MSTPHDAPYKQQQALTRQQEATATLLVPTLPTRIARLNPVERHEVMRIIRAMKLRKVIRRVLVEAHWNHEAEQVTSMRSLRRVVNRNLTPAVDATTFDLTTVGGQR